MVAAANGKADGDHADIRQNTGAPGRDRRGCRDGPCHRRASPVNGGMAQEFTLDERLRKDTFPVAELPLADLRLMNDARFPWLLLVPRRPDVAEIIDLADLDRAVLYDEIVIVSTALKAITGCDKLNVAALGNMVRQLHVHIIARFATDVAWPKPVWGSGDAVAYPAAERDRMIARIRQALPS